jgi:hypothetical protein
MQRLKSIAILLFVITVCSASGLVLAGCAGELPEPGGITTTSGITTTTAEPPTVLLSRQVAATWRESVERLVGVIADTPPFASVQADVAALKEEYVQRMVALGRQIRALSADEQQTVYDRVEDSLSAMADDDWFLRYTDIYEHYSAGEGQAAQDFAVLLVGFNVLTQYAFFDVLMAQEPAEAERLGVE